MSTSTISAPAPADTRPPGRPTSVGALVSVAAFVLPAVGLVVLCFFVTITMRCAARRARYHPGTVQQQRPSAVAPKELPRPEFNEVWIAPASRLTWRWEDVLPLSVTIETSTTSPQQDDSQRLPYSFRKQTPQPHFPLSRLPAKTRAHGSTQLAVLVALPTAPRLTTQFATKVTTETQEHNLALGTAQMPWTHGQVS